jgi:hypothetical protein
MMIARSTAAWLVLLSCTLQPLSAQQADPLAGATEANTARRLAFPNPVFRLIGIENSLKKQGVTIKWRDQYEKLAVDKLDTAAMKGDKGRLGFAAGVRLADGAIALLAKDKAKIASAAKDAEEIAGALGIPKKQITSGKALLKAIEDNDWGTIFEEMGWMQQEIVSQVDNQDRNLSMTALVACGAWLQGVRYATNVVSENMGAEDLSNSLRGPAVIEGILTELKKAPKDILSLSAVKESMAIMEKLKPMVSVKRDEKIPQEKLNEIHTLATQAVNSVMK